MDLFRLVLVFLVAVVNTYVLGINQAQDFYFLIDQSGSINDNDAKCKAENNGLKCMEVLADFANKTAFRMAGLVGNFYAPPQEGIRVGIIMFRCPKKTGKLEKVILEPSGSVDAIRAGFEKVFNQHPANGTCARGPFNTTETWIKETEKNTTRTGATPRTTSILYLTDGLLDDKTEAIEAASKVSKLNRTSIFGVTIRHKKVSVTRQKQEVSLITGDSDKVFQVESPKSLEAIVGSLTSFIFGDFTISVKGSMKPCIGERPVMLVSGLSVKDLENLNCTFAFNDLSSGPKYWEQAVETPAGFECSFPESFAHGKETIVVELFSTNLGQARKIGATSPITFDRQQCIDISTMPTPKRCIGDDTTYFLSGKTMDALHSGTHNYQLSCKFNMSVNGKSYIDTTVAQANAEKGGSYAYKCPYPKSAVDSFQRTTNSDVVETLRVRDGQNLVDYTVHKPQDIGGIEFEIKITEQGMKVPGTETATITFSGNSSQLVTVDMNAEECLAATIPRKVCWRQEKDAIAKFDGKGAQYLTSLGVNMVCLIRTGESSNPYSLVPATSNNGEISCMLPSELAEPLQDGTLTQSVLVDVYVSEGKKLLRVSDRFSDSFQFTVNPCVNVKIVGNETVCFGEARELSLASAVPITKANQVDCIFIDNLNNVTVNGTMEDKGDNMYTCKTPQAVGDYFGITFDTFVLRSKNRQLTKMEFTTQTNQCFVVRTKAARGTGLFEPIGTYADDISGCWGNANGSTFFFGGKTAKTLSRETGMSCLFDDPENITPVPPKFELTAVYSNELEGFTCAFPDELYQGTSGRSEKTSVSLRIQTSSAQRILFSQNFTMNVKANDNECFNTSVVPLVENEPACLGANVTLDITGDSLIRYLALVSGDIACQFSEDYEVNATKSDSKIRCNLPGNATLPSYWKRWVDLPLPKKSLLKLAVPGYSVMSSPVCFSSVISVGAQKKETERRRQLQSTDKKYCLGDTLSTGFAGKSLENLLTRFNANQFKCVWEVDTDFTGGVPGEKVETTPTQDSPSQLICTSPVWSPFEVAIKGAYKSVYLQLGSDQIGDAQSLSSPDYKASVCSGQITWGTQTNSSEGDCKRVNVEATLNGRSAVAFQKDPTKLSRVNCKFTMTNGTVLIKAPVFQPDAIVCTAPGWDISSPGSGEYTSVTIMVELDDKSLRDVKTETFPNTGSRECIYVLYRQKQCVGDGVNVTIAGPTLSSYEAHATASKSVDSKTAQNYCKFLHSTAASSLTSTGSGYECVAFEQFIPGKGQNNRLTFGFGDLQGNNLQVGDVDFVVNVDTMNSTCMADDYAMSTCAGTQEGTIVEFIGRTPASNINASDVQCIFRNDTSGETAIVNATVHSTDNSRIVCVSGKAFDNHTVTFEGTVLTTGAIPKDPETCVGAGRPAAPGSGDSSNLGLILGLTFGLLFLVLILAFIAYRYYQARKEDKDEDDYHAMPSPSEKEKFTDKSATPGTSIVPAEGAIGFTAGDRVEAFGCFDGSPIESGQGWFKGHVVGDNYDGTYTVRLDVIPGREEGDTDVVVGGGDVRMPLTDFGVGDAVEARFGGGNTWHRALVDRVCKNNCYDLSFDEDGLSEESMVPGDLIRPPKMIFQEGDVVEVISISAGGRYVHAKVVQVDICTESYRVAVSRLGEGGEFFAQPDTLRAFIPEQAEIVDVRIGESENYARATIQSTCAQDQTCKLNYDPADVAEFDLAVEDGDSVSWSDVFRPLYVHGQSVRVKQADNTWKVAEVILAQPNTNLYNVQYEDNTIENDIPVSRIKHASLLHSYLSGLFALGENVNVETSPGSGQWIPATITTVHQTGTYDVEYQNNHSVKNEDHVPSTRIQGVAADQPTNYQDILLEDDEIENSPYLNIWRPPIREHQQSDEGDGLEVPFHLRFRKRKPLHFAELPGNQFEVTLDMSEGLGLSLGWTNDNRVIVAGFRDLPNGDWGPVEACGLVGLKDQLLCVNDTSISGKSFVEVSELIKNSGKTIKLVFGRWSHEEGPVSMSSPPPTA
uniref:VWFA domain-containing protein n=1 Tax=Mucochytrium quahogii TaxID=96639 RepID=A0A7S2S2Z3_9STRA|mmetsp:Transcript_23902/g.52025  ORF Transcript_23902/g.52025 Transcript_23902/m.52025 type:complete len:2010 (+) Transcript_23902:355-6384(+)